jgi:hypothetical protein
MGRGRCFEGQFASETNTRPANGDRIGAFSLSFWPFFRVCPPSFPVCRRTDCPESGKHGNNCGAKAG